MKKYILISTIIHIFVISIISSNIPKTVNKSIPNESLQPLNLSILKLNKFHNNITKSSNPKETSKSQQLLENQTSEEEKQSENAETSNKENIFSNPTIIPPKILYTPLLEYPYQARLKRIEGSVLLKLTITTNGEVSDIQILKGSGYDILDKTATNYIKRIKFDPAKTLNGTPIESEITYFLHFVLK